MTPEQTNGREPSDNEVAVLIRETRADKMIEISTAEVRKLKRDRLTETEAAALIDLRNEAQSVVINVESAQASHEYAKVSNVCLLRRTMRS
jgi:hypothetical protein